MKLLRKDGLIAQTVKTLGLFRLVVSEKNTKVMKLATFLEGNFLAKKAFDSNLAGLCAGF